MATIDLGRIKFKWQGAWSSSTAYVVDDVVESGGNTYVCIAASTNNVPPNATYWELMAQKGTDTSVATTQGDIIYHNGSSLARLAAGTSGQALLTGGSGANPSWGSAGGIRQVVQTVLPHSSQSTSSNSQIDLANSETSLTPASTSSKILIMTCLSGIRKSNNTYGEFDLFRKIGSGGYSIVDRIVHGFLYTGEGTTQTSGLHHTFLDSPNTTDQVYYKIRFRSVANVASITVNVDSQESSTITLMEVTV